MLLILAARNGATWAFKASLYLVFFPFVAVAVALFKGFDVVNLLRKAAFYVGSTLARGANWLLVVVAWVVVARAVEPWVVMVAAGYMVLSAIYITSTIFVWVTNPFGSMITFTDWLGPYAYKWARSFNSKFDDAIKSYRSPKGEDDKMAARKLISDAAGSTKWVLKICYFITKSKNFGMAGRILLFYIFAGRLLVTLAAVIVIFAGVYRGMDKVDPSQLSGPVLTAWDSLYFSVTTLFTFGVPAITPEGLGAQVAVVGQLVSGMIFLTVLALSFSTFSLDAADANGRRVFKLADDVRKILHKIITNRFDLGEHTPADLDRVIADGLENALR